METPVFVYNRLGIKRHLSGVNVTRKVTADMQENMQNPGRKPGILLCEINTDIIREIKMLSNL